MKRFIKFMTVILVTVLVSTIPANACAAEQTNFFNAKASLIADAKSGQVIYEQNAKQKLPVASISKLLTVMMIADEVRDGQLKWTQPIKISPAVGKISNNSEYSSIGLQTGKSYPLNQLVAVALVKSADGATLALAGAAADSTASFNQRMHKKARQIGVKDATIINAVGLRNGDLLKSQRVAGVANKAENTMSARDVAKIATYFVNHYPHLVEIAGLTSTTIQATNGKTKTVKTINKLLTGGYAVNGVQYLGLKTGTSDKAGACLVSAAKYQGRTLITVVLHANGGNDDRFTQTQKMYQALVDEYGAPQQLHLTKRYQTIPIKHGLPLKVRVAAPALKIWIRGDAKAPYHAKVDLKNSLAKNGNLLAPIKKGTTIGTITVKPKGMASLNSYGLKAPLVTQQTVNHASWLKIAWYRMVH